MILKVIYLLCSFTFICSVHSKSDVVTEENCEGIIFEHWIIVYLFSATSVNIYYILVCVKLVRRFSDTLEGDEKNDASLIEVRFKQFCKSLKGKDERFVWPFNFLILFMLYFSVVNVLFPLIVLLCRWAWYFCHVYRQRNDKTSQLGNACWEGVREITKEGFTNLRPKIRYVSFLKIYNFVHILIIIFYITNHCHLNRKGDWFGISQFNKAKGKWSKEDLIKLGWRLSWLFGKNGIRQYG